MIVEGVLLFAEAAVRELFDLRIYVDADEETRLQRRLARDVSDRGRTPESVADQWRNSVAPMHTQFVAPTQQHAEITLHTHTEQ